MTPTLERRVGLTERPATGGDPFGQIALKAEWLRAGALAALFVGLFGLIAVLSAVDVVRGTHPDPQGALVALVTLAVVAGFEVWIARSARRRLTAQAGPSRMLPYVATVLEVGAVVLSTAVDRSTDAIEFEGGIVMLFLLLAFSVVRMRLPMTAFTGVAVAAGYLRLASASYGLDDPRRPWIAVVIVAGSVGLGLMAQAFRRGAARLVAEREAREQLQADLLASVEATQVGIGHELHDSVGSHLTGLSMLARGLVRRVERGGAVERAEAADVADLVDEALRQVRRLSRGLMASEIEPGGLRPALAALVADADRVATASVTFQSEGDGALLAPDSERHLYRIAQEAITNALRHGRPRRVEVTLGIEGPGATLTIADDGDGISMEGPEAGGGLRTMRHRADLVAGDLEVGPGPSGGTRVRVTVPTSATG